MSFTVFYMNPGATPEIREIVQGEMPAGWRLLTPANPTDFRDELEEADFLVVATEPVGIEHLRCAKHLKMIQHQGVGYETIDLAACRQHGIPVGLTPEGTSVGVAEHTLLLILAVYKQLVTAVNGIARGNWMQWSLRKDSFELAGKRLGLVGFGRIGREVAKRALAFDASVAYFDPFIADADSVDRAVERTASLDDLLSRSDIISLHVPHTTDNHHLINASTLLRMKRGAVLINTSRGGLVDEQALVDSLQQGHLGYAGLDVFEAEPLPTDHPLVALPNVILTPHIAAGTRDALKAKMQAVFANLVRFTEGETLRNMVPELKDLAISATSKVGNHANRS